MKLTRIQARNLFFNLGQVALKEVNAEVLESVMHNFDAVRKVNEDFTKLAEELAKKLYGDLHTMDEKTRKDYSDFMDIIGKYERTTDRKEADECLAAAKAGYPELFRIYEKQISVLTGLLNKEVELDIQPIDKTRFSTGIVKSNAEWPLFKVDAAFNIMFAKEDKHETDLSELDKLLKD